MKEFAFSPAAWLPSRNIEMLERVRGVRREDMEYDNENGYGVRVVAQPSLLFAMDVFHRIYLSDKLDQRLTMIFPNQWPGLYGAVAEMINKNNVSCRNVHAFAMDEWADEDGNVAPLTYGAGLGYSFRAHFYGKIRPDLRPDVENWHVFTNENIDCYSDLIDEIGGGGADVVYSAVGWPGHTAFIDPGSREFAAATMEEYLKLGSRLTTETPLTIAENSLFAPMGASGDVWAVPPRAATIGPRDIAHARYRFEVHDMTFGGFASWQRMISRIELYGDISMDCPASILRLFPGVCYVSEEIAKPFGSWTCGLKDSEL